MSIKQLSDEQVQEMLEDQYVEIYAGDYTFYVELREDEIVYAEAIRKKNGKTAQKYCVSAEELEKLKAKRPSDPSWYHNDPLCPNCRTYMIYKFEFCPKCGQKLDWSEK